jgi:hypothetical protein
VIGRRKIFADQHTNSFCFFPKIICYYSIFLKEKLAKTKKKTENAKKETNKKEIFSI